jgi:hypothetical protein
MLKYLKKVLGLCCLFALSFTQPGLGLSLDMDDFGKHCPLNAMFAAAEIKVNSDGHTVLHCVNIYGASYYTAVIPSMETWMFDNWYEQKQPKASICLGLDATECRY